MIYLQLFFAFFYTGLFAIGGGLATLPFLEEISVHTGWFCSADIGNMIAVAEVTPGAVGVNMATYAGYRAAGIPGAVAATIGLITPSVIVIFLVVLLVRRYVDSPLMKSVMEALRPASLALITAAGISVCQDALLSQGMISWKSVGIAVLLGIGWFRVRKKHILFLTLAGILGILIPDFL